MIKHIANIVTGCRILGSVLLLFFPAFSAAFYMVYIICGFSDMIDGTIARKTNSASELGAKIDTAADLLFIIVSLIKNAANTEYSSMVVDMGRYNRNNQNW